MTDQPERVHETEETEDDFEGHRNSDPERSGDVAAADENEADFEGHRHHGPDRNARNA